MTDHPKDSKDLDEPQPQVLTLQSSDRAAKDTDDRLATKARYSDLFTVFASGAALISVSDRN